MFIKVIVITKILTEVALITKTLLIWALFVNSGPLGQQGSIMDSERFSKESIYSYVDTSIGKAEKFLELEFERSVLFEQYTGLKLTQLLSYKGYNHVVTTGDKKVDTVLVESGLVAVQTNKTPDIFEVVKNKEGTIDFLLIGDVAATRDTQTVRIMKREKYSELIRDISMSNRAISIRNTDFIYDLNNISETLMCATVLNKFELDVKETIELGLTGETEEFVMDKLNLIERAKRMLMSGRDGREVSRIVTAMRVKNTYSGPISRTSDVAEDLSFRPRLINAVVNQMNRSVFPEKRPEETSFEDIKSRVMDKFDEHETAKIKKALPILMNVGFKEEKTGLMLLKDYVMDLHDTQLSGLLPSIEQVKQMIEMKDSLKGNVDELTRKEMRKKYGFYSNYFLGRSQIISKGESLQLANEVFEMTRRKNMNKSIKSINRENYQLAVDMCEEEMRKLGKIVNVVETKFENVPMFREERLIDRCRRTLRTDLIDRTVGVQAAIVMSKLATDVAYFKAKMTGIYYSIPVNSSCIALILRNKNEGRHAEAKFAFLTRSKEGEVVYGDTSNTIKIIKVGDYSYYLSKVYSYSKQRLYQLIDSDLRIKATVASLACARMLTDEVDEEWVCKATSLYTMTTLDLHQKPSEILDVMKYVVGMVCSEVCNFNGLFEKMPSFIKTEFDAWLIERLIEYCKANSTGSNARARVVIMNGNKIDKSSLGVDLTMKSFITMEGHSNVDMHFAEAQLLFQSRGKKLYGSQYMDTVVEKVVNNNKKEAKELEWDWAKGEGDVEKFDFSLEYSFSDEFIRYACNEENKTFMQDRERIIRMQDRLDLEFCSQSLSMRGSCITEKEIMDAIQDENLRGVSEPSILSNVKMVEKMFKEGVPESDFRLSIFCRKESKSKMWFNMAEKEQRGGGRPIGSPDAISKQRLYYLESYFRTIGKMQKENLLNKGIVKSAVIAGNMRSRMSEFSKVEGVGFYHLVMDQSQFSEGDNMRKFKAAIGGNSMIKEENQGVLIGIIDSIMDRRMIFKNINPNIIESNKDQFIHERIVRGTAGWVQGMLNASATYIHICAAKYIASIFKEHRISIMDKCKGNKELESLGGISDEPCNVFEVDQFINSDDSYCLVSTDNKAYAILFYKFFEIAKNLAVLKQNVKKSYISSSIGEIVQKYIVGGNVLNIWQKAAVSSFEGMLGLEPSKDSCYCSNQISSLYKEGAPETFLCYLRSLMRTKYLRMYEFGSGKTNDMSLIGIDVGKLPQEMMGWPKYVSTFEICVSGTEAQRHRLLKEWKSDEERGEVSNEMRACIGSIICSVLESRDYNIEESNGKLCVTRKLKSTMTEESKRMDDNVREMFKRMNQEDGKGTKDEHIDIISFSAGEDAGFHSNIIRKYVNSIKVRTRVDRKITRTVDKLAEFRTSLGGDKNALAGLIKVVSSIRKFWAYLIDGMDSHIIGIVESGYQRSYEWVLRNLQLMNRGRPVSLKAWKGLMSFNECMTNMIRTYNAFRGIEGKTVEVDWKDILSMNIEKAAIAYEVAQLNMKRDQRINDKIANILPMEEYDIPFSNNVKDVACELLSPGSTKTEMVQLRIPANLEKDKEIMLKILKVWEKQGVSFKSIVTSFVNQYTGINKKRVLIGPPIRTVTLRSTIRDMALSCFDGKYQYAADKYLEASIGSNQELKNNRYLDDLMSIISIVSVLNIKEGIAMDGLNDSLEFNIEGEAKKLTDIFKVDNEKIMQLLNKGIKGFQREQIIAMMHKVTNDDSYVLTHTPRTMRINWIQDQQIESVYRGGKVVKQYYGPFVVEITDGVDKVVIHAMGEFKITKIISTTNARNKIDQLIKHLLLTVEFKGKRADMYERGWWTNSIMKGNTSLKESGLKEFVDYDSMGFYTSRNIEYFQKGRSIPLKVVEGDGRSWLHADKIKHKVIWMGQKMMYENFYPDSEDPHLVIARLSTTGNQARKETINRINKDLTISYFSLRSLLNSEHFEVFMRGGFSGLGAEERLNFLMEVSDRSMVINEMFKNVYGVPFRIINDNGYEFMQQNLGEEKMMISADDDVTEWYKEDPMDDELGTVEDVGTRQKNKMDELRANMNIKLTDEDKVIRNRVISLTKTKATDTIQEIRDTLSSGDNEVVMENALENFYGVMDEREEEEMIDEDSFGLEDDEVERIEDLSYHAQIVVEFSCRYSLLNKTYIDEPLDSIKINHKMKRKILSYKKSIEFILNMMKESII